MMGCWVSELVGRWVSQSVGLSVSSAPQLIKLSIICYDDEFIYSAPTSSVNQILSLPSKTLTTLAFLCSLCIHSYIKAL